jgi:hypothetical protein
MRFGRRGSNTLVYSILGIVCVCLIVTRLASSNGEKSPESVVPSVQSSVGVSTSPTTTTLGERVSSDESASSPGPEGLPAHELVVGKAGPALPDEPWPDCETQLLIFPDGGMCGPADAIATYVESRFKVVPAYPPTEEEDFGSEIPVTTVPPADRR